MGVNTASTATEASVGTPAYQLRAASLASSTAHAVASRSSPMLMSSAQLFEYGSADIGGRRAHVVLSGPHQCPPHHQRAADDDVAIVARARSISVFNH
jgi:hypothetical protein